MIGIPVALAVSNATEWVMHRYVLHGMGKKRGSFWRFHFHDHHKAVRKSEGFDDAYSLPGWRWDAKGKEVFSLAVASTFALPLFPVAPFFTTTLLACGVRYYLVHRKAHLDPTWMRNHLPWHYDHHMGPDQECNWCVTHPWFDTVMGTRKPYAFTEQEALDMARRRPKVAGVPSAGSTEAPAVRGAASA